MSPPHQPGEVPASALSEFERLLRAWRYARAQWDLASNDPTRPEGLSNKEDAAFCDRHHEALLAFLCHPAETPKELAIKLNYVCEQAVWTFDQALAIFEQIASETHELAFTSSRRGAA